MPKGQAFSGEFKQKVIEDLLENGLGFRETAKKYGLPSHEPVRKWERIYRTEGIEGLYVEHRGRKRTKLPKQLEEDLIAENQRLRMEIDYLKKLSALVSKKKQQNRKRK